MRVAGVARTFRAFLEQQVLAQADAQKRYACRHTFADGLHLAKLLHGGGRIGERANARQHDSVGSGYLARIRRDASIAARRAQPALNR